MRCSSYSGADDRNCRETRDVCVGPPGVSRVRRWIVRDRSGASRCDCFCECRKSKEPKPSRHKTKAWRSGQMYKTMLPPKRKEKQIELQKNCQYGAPANGRMQMQVVRCDQGAAARVRLTQYSIVYGFLRERRRMTLRSFIERGAALRADLIEEEDRRR